MDYRHLTTDEMIRQIGAQAGDDLELEGELIRRVRADEIRFFEHNPIKEQQEEIDELNAAIAVCEAEKDGLEAQNDALAEKLKKVAAELDTIIRLELLAFR